MAKCRYKDIPNDSENFMKLQKHTDWKPYLKQLLICSGVWTSVFLFGLTVAGPTTFIPQIRREANDTNVITDDMGSWLNSVYGFSGFPCYIILTVVTKLVGRKIPFIIAVLDTLVALILLYCSSNITHILISQIMQGVFCASQFTVSVMILTEYTSPKYRGMFLIIKTATFYWGIWVSNAIGTFFHWKKIPLFGIICSLYILINVLLWPESPYWLASRGRFEECAASHRSLKGCDEDAEKELEALISSQQEYIASYGNTKLTAREHVNDFLKTIKSKEFWKPTALSITTGFLGYFCGKIVFVLYAIDILKEITKSETTAYVAMLVLDGFTVLSMYGGSILSKYLKRRTLLLGASSVGVMFLFILSLYLYLISLSVIIENKYVSILLFAVFSITVSCGPLTMCLPVSGELIPIRSRNLSFCIISLSGEIVASAIVQNSPLLFKTFGLHGTCLFFGIGSMISVIILYKYLPETKDKTLHEIADSINDVKPHMNEVSSKLLVCNKDV